MIGYFTDQLLENLKDISLSFFRKEGVSPLAALEDTHSAKLRFHFQIEIHD